MSEKDTKQTFISPLSGRYGGPGMPSPQKTWSGAGKNIRRIFFLVCAVLIVGVFVVVGSGCIATEKPVIYLYPETEMEVSVKLDYAGELTCTYPLYQDGWVVMAHPDGSLTWNEREYSYLYWEGEADIDYDMTKGFVVKGEDSAAFLEEKLDLLGLTPREANEFIVYWLPRLEANAWNLITFQTEAYTEAAELIITPTPDAMLRVFMVFKALDQPIEIEEPELESFTRIGFTVVEWGGSELK